MSALFTLGRAWSEPPSGDNKLWVGIEVDRLGLLPQKAGSIILMHECSSLDQLKAVVGQMKHELDVVVADAAQAFENGEEPSSN
jgi:hypothetical protein